MTKKEIKNILLGVFMSVFLSGMLHGTRIYPFDLFDGLLFRLFFNFVPYFIFVFVLFFLAADNVFGRVVDFLSEKKIRILMAGCYVLLFFIPAMDIVGEKELFAISHILFYAGAVTLTNYLNTRDNISVHENDEQL